MNIAEQHGFKYVRDCQCANPGAIYHKGKIKLTLHSKKPTFLLIRPGNHNVSGQIDDLERTLTTYGI